MKKRLLSLLLCLAMLASMLPVSVQAAAPAPAAPAAAAAPEIPTEGDVWDGSITEPTKLVQKDGVYYYEITKCSELAYVARTGGEWLECNYILGDNLILNDVVLTWDEEGNCTNEEELLEWTPINGFSSIFLGGGYTISGLYISSGSTVGLFGTLSGDVDGVCITNSYISGDDNVGGLAGIAIKIGADISNCSMAGLVRGRTNVGGLIGKADGQYIDSLINFADVYGGSYVAGIAGAYSSYEISNCINYGNIYADGDHVGGITTETGYRVKYCRNIGNVTGNDHVGGIVSRIDYVYLDHVSNSGSITGRNYVGGICGYTSYHHVQSWMSTILDSYNTGSVHGESSVGGITGVLIYSKIQNCYNAGAVSFSTLGGAVAGDSDHIWGRSAVSGCYYLKDQAHNSGIDPFGVVSGDTDGVAEAASHSEMQLQSTFENWDFHSVWSIAADKNGGYPYLQWQEDMMSDVAVNGVTVSETALSLPKGDYAYLTVTVSPINADNRSVTWSSSAPDVATVTSAGKVTAVSPGTATITATTKDGGYTASCTVTVTERIPEEYRINSITVRDSNGAVLSEIPVGTCLATVSITNVASEGSTLVFIASYTAAGQYQGMMWLSVEDLPIGATIKVTVPVDNSDGKLADLTAFVVASFSDLTPLGGAVSFLP